MAVFPCSLLSRVDALQLGDCGQEMALISRLTEGSKVFLSREESQHFVKKSVSVIVQNKVVLANMTDINLCLRFVRPPGAPFSTARLCSSCCPAGFKTPLTL